MLVSTRFTSYIAVLACACTLVPLASAAGFRLNGAGHRVDPPRPFAANSIWNQKLAPSAALDRHSATYVRELVKQVKVDGPYLNTFKYSTPVFTVPRTQRDVRVKLDYKDGPVPDALRASWRRVPIPPRAKPSIGTDGAMVVWQPSTDRMWEFWRMHRRRDGWHATWGGTIDHASTNPGYYTDPTWWGTNATSLDLLGGLIRPSELAAGRIDHALEIGLPYVRARYFTWPAQRTDGWVDSPSAIPEGQRFRIDPRLNLSKIKMSPLVRMMAVAAQKYGIIVNNKSGAVTFVAEDTFAEGRGDPYYGIHGWYRGQYVGELLQKFPWSHLEALKDTMACCWITPADKPTLAPR